ncbi:MAG TPA: aminotransferase class III-fold pyridoxal phosphate-dependent enzyme [Candidatus Dormibacteraeota bacterium]
MTEGARVQVRTSATADQSPADGWRTRDAAVISGAYARYTDLVVESAQGAHLRTVDGRDVLDFGCGIGVTTLGHQHPAVVGAVMAQADRLWHTSVTALHPAMIEAAEALVRVTPAGLDRVFWCNSGAEAVEGAIKLARKATGRPDIIAFEGAFHGRTYGALSLTASRERYRAGVGPFLPGVHHVAYPTCVTAPGHVSGECCASAEREIGRLLNTRVSPGDVAAIVVEPVLGEGGYVVPPPGFLPALRRLCDSHGILLVADEVQTGMARTGRMFAVEHTGVVPDIMTVAKGLGNGLPVAAVVARHEHMDAWHPGDHGTTYGGNAVACAAACAVIETIERDQLCARAERLGALVLERARGWQAEVPALADVRGLGLMVGLELRHPDGSAARELVKGTLAAALRRDLLVLSCGVEGNVIRLLPPVTISEADLERGLSILESCLVETCG